LFGSDGAEWAQWTDLTGCVTKLKFHRLAVHSYNRCRREQFRFDILTLFSQSTLRHMDCDDK